MGRGRDPALEEPRLVLPSYEPQTLLGPSFRVTRDHGRFVDSSLDPHVTATLHPSAILRRPSDAERRQEMGRFVADLRGVAKVLAGTKD